MKPFNITSSFDLSEIVDKIMISPSPMGGPSWHNMFNLVEPNPIQFCNYKMKTKRLRKKLNKNFSKYINWHRLHDALITYNECRLANEIRDDIDRDILAKIDKEIGEIQ